MDLFWAKTAFAVVVLAAGISGALLPWLLDSRAGSDRALAIGNTFSGGVLGGAALLHLLSDGFDQFHESLPGVGYPLATLLAGVGFLLILLIEGVIVAGRAGSGAGHGGHGAAAQHEIGWPPRAEGRHLLYPVVLLIVLSIHSLILGLALGAQRSFAGALIVFLAIVTHKAVAGFALGIGYQRAGFTARRATPQILFFSTMTPLGILVGAAVGALLAAHAGQLFEAGFDSLGAGTLLYIAALDIIRTEFDSSEDRWQKWFAALLGFAGMAVLAVWL